MVVSIDDLSDETRKVVTTWGKTIGVDVRELREREWLGFSVICCLKYFLLIVRSGGIGKGKPRCTYPRTAAANCDHLLHIRKFK